MHRAEEAAMTLALWLLALVISGPPLVLGLLAIPALWIDARRRWSRER